MPLKSETLQQQLTRAQGIRSEIEKGLGDKTAKKQTNWRRADARVRQIESRLQANTLLKGTPGESEAANDADQE